MAGLKRANVANVAITEPGTMLRNGLQRSNARPSYFLETAAESSIKPLDPGSLQP
jgi:hypothetical protein